jgi:hypothetical protein
VGGGAHGRRRSAGASRGIGCSGRTAAASSEYDTFVCFWIAGCVGVYVCSECGDKCGCRSRIAIAATTAVELSDAAIQSKPSQNAASSNACAVRTKHAAAGSWFAAANGANTSCRKSIVTLWIGTTTLAYAAAGCSHCWGFSTFFSGNRNHALQYTVLVVKFCTLPGSF